MLFTERLPTQHRNQILDISPRVAELVKKSAITDGLCIVFVPHTTAAVSLNENADPDVKRDVLDKLNTLIPEKEHFYQHAEQYFAILLTYFLPPPASRAVPWL